MANTYDFYKPKLDSEYPEVDGPVSVVTYIAALDAAYSRFKEKLGKATKLSSINGQINGDVAPKSTFSLDDVDYAIFHSPYGKQTVKAHARVLFQDFLANHLHPKFAKIPSPETILATSYTASLTDKSIEKNFITAAKSAFASQVGPSMACSRRLGNMYTGSLYGCLASLVSTVEPAHLTGKRVSLFAFGSGCAASFFALHVKGDTTGIKEKMNLINRLASMKVVPCQEYVDALAVSFSNVRDMLFR
jgi:hydroxymethylglutaryl-CoA synthase